MEGKLVVAEPAVVMAPVLDMLGKTDDRQAAKRSPASSIIDEEASAKKASDVPEMTDALAGGNVLLGVRVTTTDGRELGKIEDFYFDPQTGVVKGFELSGGKGREFLPTPASFQAGRDVAFVDPSAAETIIGLKEALRGD